MKAIAEAKILRSEDCWRLLVACLRYDDGTGRMFAALCDGGAIETLFRLKGKHQLLAQLTRLSTQDPLALKALQHHPALPHFAIEAPEGGIPSHLPFDTASHTPSSNSTLHAPFYTSSHTPSHTPFHTPSHTTFREIIQSHNDLTLTYFTYPLHTFPPLQSQPVYTH